MREDLFKGLTEEQISKARNCRNVEEVISLAKSEGIELTEEQLAAVTGGGCFSSNKCPNCGSKDYEYIIIQEKIATKKEYRCKKCGRRWCL